MREQILLCIIFIGACGRGGGTPADGSAVGNDGSARDGGGAPCRSDSDCDSRTEFCVRPDPVQYSDASGTCPYGLARTCSVDVDCASQPPYGGGGPPWICAPLPCPAPATLRCARGCNVDNDCAMEAQVCDANHHCVYRSCTTDADCPSWFACDANRACAKRACSGDADCHGGACLGPNSDRAAGLGTCDQALGSCTLRRE
jgi:hypothetical protein